MMINKSISLHIFCAILGFTKYQYTVKTRGESIFFMNSPQKLYMISSFLNCIYFPKLWLVEKYCFTICVSFAESYSDISTKYDLLWVSYSLPVMTWYLTHLVL